MSSDTAKRRRVGEGDSGGGDGIPPVGGGGGGRDNDNSTSMHQELSEMKSKMNELMGNMTSMMQMMQSQSRDISQLTQANATMQGDINRLTQKCHSIETSILDNHTTNSTMTSLLRTTCDRIEEKQKYHDVMLQNQKWEYSAERPSDDYWEDIEGEDEDGEAEEFLEQIKRYTEEMRYGTGNGEIVLNAHLPYNEEFLPHWKEFANALEQYHYHLKQSPDTVSNLELFNMDLPETVIDLLSKALKSTHFQKIDMRHNNFGQKGINFTLKYLRSNRNVKELYLIGNPINNTDDINKLCKIVKVHPTIECLTLANCKGGDINGYDMLTRIMTAGKNKLKFIDLSNNRIRTEGRTYICDFLATNLILTDLFLENNQLSDNDAIGIAEALRQNTKLFFLRLTHNNITKTGWKALRKAEFDNSSLNAASDSNHTCNIKYPPDGSDAIEGLDISEMNGDRNHQGI